MTENNIARFVNVSFQFNGSNLTEGNTFSNRSHQDANDNLLPKDIYFFYVVDRINLMIPVCTIGIIFNILNIVVLTRKRMRSSINVLLTSLAISDLTCIVFEIVVPMVIRSILPPEVPDGYGTYTTGIFSIADYYVAFWFNNVSNWITVTIGIWRYVAVTSPLRAQIWCTTKRAKFSIGVIVLISSILATPEAFLNGIRPATGFNSTTIYEMHLRSFVFADDQFVYKVYKYVYVILKLTPCVILVYVTLILIRTLCRAATIRRKLRQEKDKKDTGKPFDRTTAMMLTVIVIFLIGNLPYAIMVALNLASGISFLNNELIDKLEDYFQLATILNYTVNFPIYYLMSRKFRNTFLGFFCGALPNVKRRHLQTSTSTTVETLADDNSLKVRNLNARDIKVSLTPSTVL